MMGIRNEFGYFSKAMHRSAQLCPLTPNDPNSGRTAPLTSKVAFLYFLFQFLYRATEQDIEDIEPTICTRDFVLKSLQF